MSTEDSPQREFDAYDTENVPIATLEHEDGTSNPPNPRDTNLKSSRKPRREVWWLELSTTNQSLKSIGWCFEDRLNRSLLSSSNSLLRHIRSPKDDDLKRNVHQCPGYLREEITLTCDVSKSAVVSHTFPDQSELCSICHQLVQHTYSEPDYNNNTSDNLFSPSSAPSPHVQPTESALSNMSSSAEMDPAGLRSTSGPPQSGQFTIPVQAPFQAAFPQEAGISVSQTQSIVAGDGGTDYNPEAAYSSSPNVEGSDSMDIDLSSSDSLPSHMVSHPQIPPHLSPPPTFSRTKYNQMDTSNTSTDILSNVAQQGSRTLPSLAPNLNEPATINFLFPPEAQHHGKNHSNGLPAVSTSPFNFPNHDDSVHQTNIVSFNVENTTIRNLFNNNAQNYMGKFSGIFCFLIFVPHS
jgi:hypothetical protein